MISISTYFCAIAFGAIAAISIWRLCSRQRLLLPGNTLVGAVGGVTGLLIVAFIAHQELTSQSELEAYIRCFPRIDSETMVPTMNQRSGERVWMFTTDSSSAAVLRFHADKQNHVGWQLRETGVGAITLERGDARLVIGVAEANGRTTIVYRLMRKASS